MASVEEFLTGFQEPISKRSIANKDLFVNRNKHIPFFAIFRAFYGMFFIFDKKIKYKNILIIMSKINYLSPYQFTDIHNVNLYL